MIILQITEREKTVVYPVIQHSPFQTTHQAATTEAAEKFKEAQRRQQIITALVKNFNYKEGQEAWPATEAHVSKWGKCTIIGICSQYIHLEKDIKWPANDNPMIVTASSHDGEIFNATTNFFKVI